MKGIILVLQGGDYLKLYITRHGRTEWNTIGRLQGWLDSPLTEEGIKRAERLSKRLENIDFDSIYSSSQKRALDTAHILNKKNIEIQILDELKELSLGKWEGMKLKDVEKEYPQEHYLYFNEPDSYKSLGGENFDELFLRVKKALKEIMDTKDENILIVSHGVTIKAMIAILKGIDLDEFVSEKVYTGTSLTIFEIHGDKIECILEGDDSHLL